MKLIMIMVTTADGIIAKDSNQNVDWTSKADKKMFAAETKKHGAIIMGSTTFAAMGHRPLPGRFNLILSSTPQQQGQAVPGQLEFMKGSPAEVVEYLSNKGYASAVLAGGARTNAVFLKEGLVDEIWLTVEPKLFGGGLNFTEGEDFNLDLELLEAKEIGEGVVQLRYKVKKSNG